MAATKKQQANNQTIPKLLALTAKVNIVVPKHILVIINAEFKTVAFLIFFFFPSSSGFVSVFTVPGVWFEPWDVPLEIVVVVFLRLEIIPFCCALIS